MQKLQFIPIILTALLAHSAKAQGSECRLIHRECVIIYEFFRMEKIQEIRDRDMLRNMLPYPREIEIIERSSTRLRRATETGRYSTVFSREIARMALCEATERLLIADQSNLKVRTEYNKNCQ